jgi:DnaJ-class molecular chaperone
MKFKDYYETFGLPREATQDEIKRAYRKLARKYHPDVSKAADAESRFKELGEAYAVLKDPEKRAAYDQMGSQWQAGQDFQPPPGWDDGFEYSGSGGDGEDQSDFFEALFGRQARGARRSGSHGRGDDHHAPLELCVTAHRPGGTFTCLMLRDAQKHPACQRNLSRVAPVAFSAISFVRQRTDPGYRCD